tara:strand:+ start:399741 stop:400157 length:417 start_codon:yes stop_codon:yes gene_type:complete
MPVEFNTGFPSTGSLQLQVCTGCGHVNYPSRELCGRCLADALQWQPVSDSGVVQSLTLLHYSLEADYSNHLPWPVGSIKLDCGPIAFAHLQPGLRVNAPVVLKIMADKDNNAMLVATAEDSPELQQWLHDIQFTEASS